MPTRPAAARAYRIEVVAFIRDAEKPLGSLTDNQVWSGAEPCRSRDLSCVCSLTQDALGKQLRESAVAVGRSFAVLDHGRFDLIQQNQHSLEKAFNQEGFPSPSDI